MTFEEQSLFISAMGLDKFLDPPYTGTHQMSFDDFAFKLQNQLTVSEMVGKEVERSIPTGALRLLAETENQTMAQVTAARAAWTPELIASSKGLYTIIACNTDGRALDILEEEKLTRCGVTAWARLR